MTVICSQRYYPPWSARGIRSVECHRPATVDIQVVATGVIRPVCGIHANVLLRRDGYVRLP